MDDITGICSNLSVRVVQCAQPVENSGYYTAVEGLQFSRLAVGVCRDENVPPDPVDPPPKK